jgi:nucleotide-binding universal stress UspA family protein
MWDMEPRKVLVGVERTDCEAALQYAVEDAVRRRCGIHLAHVAHPSLGTAWSGDEISVVEGQLRHVDELVLAAAQARTQALLDARAPGDDDLTVSTELTHGTVVGVLSSMSEHASRLVLQHERTGPGSGLLSVSADLADKARCPVVVVPRAWRPATDGPRPVLVGVEELSQAGPLVSAADREAVARGVRLRVLVVGPGAEGDLPSTESPVELVVAGGSLTDALLDAAGDADLVVVGVHHQQHGESTIRSLLDHCPLPLLLVKA